MEKKNNTRNWLVIILAACLASGVMTTLLNVGKALASVSWNF